MMLHESKNDNNIERIDHIHQNAVRLASRILNVYDSVRFFGHLSTLSQEDPPEILDPEYQGL